MAIDDRHVPDDEATEADYLEQQRLEVEEIDDLEAPAEDPTPGDKRVEANEADVAEQAIPVTDDDEHPPV